MRTEEMEGLFEELAVAAQDARNSLSNAVSWQISADEARDAGYNEDRERYQGMADHRMNLVRHNVSRIKEILLDVDKDLN